jgi:serralysin
VRSSVISLNLASYANVEHILLTGTAHIDATGNFRSNNLIGNSGNNDIKGLGGNDQLRGEGGSDYLYGGLGNDSMTGGTGRDQFIFNTALNPFTNVDNIADFRVVDDTIRLDNAIFTKLAATGTLNSAFFRVGSGALDSNDYIIYDDFFGTLTYDSNGSAAGGETVFATIGTFLNMTNADFFVI